MEFVFRDDQLARPVWPVGLSESGKEAISCRVWPRPRHRAPFTMFLKIDRLHRSCAATSHGEYCFSLLWHFNRSRSQYQVFVNETRRWLWPFGISSAECLPNEIELANLQVTWHPNELSTSWESVSLSFRGLYINLIRPSWEMEWHNNIFCQYFNIYGCYLGIKWL